MEFRKYIHHQIKINYLKKKLNIKVFSDPCNDKFRYFTKPIES